MCELLVEPGTKVLRLDLSQGQNIAHALWLLPVQLVIHSLQSFAVVKKGIVVVCLYQSPSFDRTYLLLATRLEKPPRSGRIPRLLKQYLGSK